MLYPDSIKFLEYNTCMLSSNNSDAIEMLKQVTSLYCRYNELRSMEMNIQQL